MELQRSLARHSAPANFCYYRACGLKRPPQFLGSVMTTFDEREHAFEEKYAHDEELKFKARARRDKLLGLWAAEKLGKTGPEAENYASGLVVAEIRRDSAEQIFKTIRADFDNAGIGISDREIHKKMDELFATAVKEITKGTAEKKA
jgi:hypothetical protein